MNEYPKMLYRKYQGEEPMVVCEGHKLDHMIVESEDEELAALDKGWRTTLLPEQPKEKRVDPRDAEIARLKAELADTRKAGAASKPAKVEPAVA